MSSQAIAILGLLSDCKSDFDSQVEEIGLRRALEALIAALPPVFDSIPADVARSVLAVVIDSKESSLRK